jgi:hypothetical protein
MTTSPFWSVCATFGEAQALLDGFYHREIKLKAEAEATTRIAGWSPRAHRTSSSCCSVDTDTSWAAGPISERTAETAIVHE